MAPRFSRRGVDPINANRAADVLETLEADVFHREFKLAFDLIANCLADADAIWSGKRLQSCCNIDTIAKNLIAIDYDISHVNADAELHFLYVGHGGIAFLHPALKLDPTAQGVHHARELHEHAVAGRLDDPAPVLGDLEIYEGSAVGLELREGAFLVDAHEAAVASHIGCQNGREPSLHAFAGQAPLRDRSKTVYAYRGRGQDSMGRVLQPVGTAIGRSGVGSRWLPGHTT